MTLIYPEPQKECIIKPFKKDSLDAIWYCEKILGRIRDGSDSMGQPLYNF